MNTGELNQEQDLPVAERIAWLISRFMNQALTPAEREELDDWVGASDENLLVFERLTSNAGAMLDWHERLDKEKALKRIKTMAGIKQPAPRSIFRRLWPYGVAACILIFCFVYFLPRFPGREGHAGLSAVRPGTNKAVLTLPGGRTIILGATAGRLARLDNLEIFGQDGELYYKGMGTGSSQHTLSVPRGGYYRVLLSDGTRVWLNAESSLSFPAVFSPGTREVRLRGQAYFDVARASSSLFRVIVEGPQEAAGKVEVLGTRFVINAYAGDGPPMVTLLEGSVKISNGADSSMLSPGQQALVDSSISMRNADTEAETAWKNGSFLFREASIESIAAQIARWYDVEIDYKGGVTYHFNATISRNEPLPRLLYLLEGTEIVSFALEGKKLIIRPRTASR
ncbi:MAG TPA: FecR domain-containing protein [Flavisolibacter sp.]|nr:FecR domain-containing protein [Flavisolibacter sp.]